MLDLIVNSSITHSLLIVLPVGCAVLLHRVRCPGWPIVAGAIAGILLGPTILGRIAPNAFEKHFVGGVAERVALSEQLRRRDGELAAANEARLDATRMNEIRERHAPAIQLAQTDWERAQWKFQRPFRSYASAFIVLSLLGAGVMQVRGGDRRQGFVTPVSIGLWSAAIPGGAAAAGMFWLWGSTRAEAALAAAAVAIGPWILNSVDRATADTAELGGARMIQTAGRVASLAALLTAGLALANQRGTGGLIWFAPLLALPAGWLLPPVSRPAIVRGILEYAVVPVLGACVAIRVELFEHFSLWPLVVFAFLSGDGRWLGAFTGAMLPGGRRGLRTMRLVLGSMAAGPTQLAVAAVATHTYGVPEEIPLALLLGAVLIEVTADARRSLARRLIETEEELEDMSRDE